MFIVAADMPIPVTVAPTKTGKFVIATLKNNATVLIQYISYYSVFKIDHHTNTHSTNYM